MKEMVCVRIPLAEMLRIHTHNTINATDVSFNILARIQIMWADDILREGRVSFFLSRLYLLLTKLRYRIAL